MLLASNHQSFLDPILLTNALPRECHYMARDTLFRNKHFARIIRMYNSFPIKRGKADLAGVKETLRRLKAGVLVLTFPEGTRSPDGRVFPFHPGVFAIARKARVPIVPAAIEGAHEAWPRGAKLPRPARVWVEYGQPIPVDVIRGTDARQATKDLTAQVRTLHNNLRRRIGRKPFDYGEEMENGKWKMENGK
ncbi:MAG: 1-acyl-sn-glycerol-3-phosphate acyltransferase [Phycisphaerae bacterium]|nr:1-acyl-sn-glycerol-3-phosphate acyltransferase [Phycisphaerae bacterium]